MSGLKLCKYNRNIFLLKNIQKVTKTKYTISLSIPIGRFIPKKIQYEKKMINRSYAFLKLKYETPLKF